MYYTQEDTAMRLNYNKLVWVSMVAIILASGIYSWMFVSLLHIGLELFLSSALSFSLLLPLTWAYSKAGAAMKIAGFSDNLILAIVIVVSQFGIFLGLFLGLWSAGAL